MDEVIIAASREIEVQSRRSFVVVGLKHFELPSLELSVGLQLFGAIREILSHATSGPLVHGLRAGESILRNLLCLACKR